LGRKKPALGRKNPALGRKNPAFGRKKPKKTYTRIGAEKRYFFFRPDKYDPTFFLQDDFSHHGLSPLRAS
jgi:hypothetical protein